MPVLGNTTKQKSRVAVMIKGRDENNITHEAPKPEFDFTT